MRSFIIVALAAALLIGGWPPAPARAFEPAPSPLDALDKLELPTGAYALVWDADHEWYAAGANPRVTDKADARVHGLPKFASDHPMFVVFRFDGVEDSGLLAAAFDESGGTGSGYDRAYIDCNRNWDLSDDAPCFVRHEQPQDLNLWFDDGVSGRVRTSDWVNVSPGDGRASEHGASVSLTPYDLGNTDHRSCIVLRRGDWSVKLATNMGELDVRVTDSNCDGVYGDISKGEGWQGDIVQINDMRLADRQSVNAEIRLTPAVRVGRRLLSIRAEGESLSIGPYSGPTGTLRVVAGGILGRGCRVRQLTVTGQLTGRMDLLDLDARPIDLPAGDYGFDICSLMVSAPGGAPVRVDCKFAKDFTRSVSADQPTPLVLGGALATALSPEHETLIITPGRQNGYNRTINLGGLLSVRSINVSDLAAPEVQFRDRGGRVVASFASEFT